ncbi:MAG: glycosyltransferase, partial [Flavobacterium sp.]
DNMFFLARLVGAPSDLSIDYLSGYIKEKGLENNIIVVGPRFDDNKFLEFHNADIFVFPTYYENETFGIVNLEAMQYKLPIISSHEGGIPEIVIENKTGFIINPKDINLLADKLRVLINNSSLRKEMGENSFRRFNDNYTIEHFEINMRNAFNAILQRA